MTVAHFRRIALSLREATEGAHMGHPDFRVKGKIFATLFRRGGVDWGVVKLTPPQQRLLVEGHPEIFQPVKGGWGRKGYTQVRLGAVDHASRTVVRGAVFTAWSNTAPERLREGI